VGKVGELLTYSVLNPPSGIQFELIPGELTCDGVEIQFKLQDSSLVAKDLFAQSSLKIVGSQSDAFIAKGSNPVLKFAA